MEYPHRKTIRLKNYDYSTPGYYFITVCAKDKKKLFGDLVAGDEFKQSQPVLCKRGETVCAQLEAMTGFYSNIVLEKYVVMPNHVHMLLQVKAEQGTRPSILSAFVGTFKRFCNKSCGEDLWQSRSYDHVVRNEKDYQRIWEYIDNNPTRWTEDSLYTP